jgi:sec-independent protein translocase protein TatC
MAILNPKKKDPNKEMHFLDHLEALRWHLVRSAIAIVVFAIIAFVNKKIIFDMIILAPKEPDFFTYRMLCALSERTGIDMCIMEIPFNLININISGQFTTHIFVSLITGFVVAFPYFIWEMWRFIAPALSNNEKSHSRGVVFFSSVLFAFGILFGYFVISPLSVNFLGSYQISETVANQISLNSFISTITILTFSCGVVFELPIVVFFLSKVGIITPAFMRRYRKHAMVINLILAAFITPSPDVASQMLVAVPLFLLYEVSIWVSAMVYARSNKEEANN